MMKGILGLSAVLVVAGGVLEAGLRAAPGALIPLNWLRSFESDLRTAIAVRLELPNRDQTVEIPRSDGGPPLFVSRPGSRTVQAFAAADVSVVEHDAQGFCNAPYDRYDREQIDLLALGDSFATCVSNQPEESWYSLTGKLTELTVYGLGRGGVGPYEYLQLLQHFGLSKHPRMVIMQIYEGNDLRDSLRYHEHVAAAGEGVVLYRDAGDRHTPELPYDRLLDNPLGRNSYLANTMVVATGKLTDAIGNAIDRLRTGESLAGIDFRYTLDFGDRQVAFNVQNADRGEVRQARALARGDIGFEAFDAALERFAALGREHGFLPVLSYAPSAHTAYAEFVRFADETLAELMPRFSQAQRSYLADRAAQLGLEFIDLTLELQQAARSSAADELLYSPVNVHYTVAGHGVAAEILARRLGRVTIVQGQRLPLGRSHDESK